MLRYKAGSFSAFFSTHSDPSLPPFNTQITDLDEFRGAEGPYSDLILLEGKDIQAQLCLHYKEP